MKTIRLRVLGGAVIVAVAVILTACHGGSQPAPSTAPPPPPQTVAAASTATGALHAQTAMPGAAQTSAAAQAKISTRLAAVARRVRTAASGTQAAELSSATVHVNKRREIQVYIHVKQLDPALEKAIVEAGAREVRESRPLGLYQAWATPAAIERIAGLPEVTKIAPPVYGFPRTGGH